MIEKLQILMNKKKEGKIKEFYSKHKWAKNLTIVIVMVVLFVIAMFATIAAINGNRPAQAEMPNVSGVDGAERLTKDDAVKLLNSLGFKDISFEEEYNDEVEKGYVISQFPENEKNFRINVDEKVTLTISKGQKIVTLPKKMVGKKVEDVIAELTKLELKQPDIIEETSETVEAGIVLEVDPEEGEEMTASTVVQLTVSKGSAYKDVVVPSVLNNPEATAVDTLNALKLKVNVSYDEDTSKSDGIVISQSINPGKTAKEEDAIEIVVNKHPVKSKLTVNVNLKSLMDYTEPTPQTVPTPSTNTTNTTNSTDENTTVVETVTPEIEKANVVIVVGEDIILNKDYLLTATNITQSWSASGVKELKVKVDGVTKFTKNIDFNKGDQTVDVK